MNYSIRNAIREGYVRVFYWVRNGTEIQGRIYFTPGADVSIAHFAEPAPSEVVVFGNKYEMDTDFYKTYGEEVANVTEAVTKGRDYLKEMAEAHEAFRLNLTLIEDAFL